MNIDEARELAEKHWEFLERWQHMIFVDGFVHGVKHGQEVFGERHTCEYPVKVSKKGSHGRAVQRKTPVCFFLKGYGGQAVILSSVFLIL